MAGMEGDLLTRKDLEQLTSLMQEHLTLAENSNKILHDMRKWGRVAFWTKVAVWTVVLILPVILFPFIAPFLNVLPGGLGGGTTASSTSLFGFPSPTEVLKALHP